VPYYDPYDFEINTDPCPVWKRRRDLAPPYFNHRLLRSFRREASYLSDTIGRIAAP
jgi:hypothetical protein